jgi:thiamine biosynthesis lipoprotein
MSVTVVCKQGIYSDGLSTACFILGYEDSLPLLEQYDAEAVFVTTDAEVLVTDGLKDSFTLTNDDFVLR